MRVKTSVTLPEELLVQIDRVDSNRSAWLERAARRYLAQLTREGRERRDAEIIEANLERLNEEALDALQYQNLP
jgi:metal-responsive CopG/Arc/MetJ family transcriptional regulator